ncbi:MAG TPA: undecaprenyl-diphosphate phosphatase [Candidatus Korarchaeota archaeon]|nr:undecaprenyl-diphosphate phosphatase [Candidatus Korarchaeota archaeon]
MKVTLDLLTFAAIGALQGILEWLPVSSEGQISMLLAGPLRVPPAEAISLALWLHLGTALAASAYLRKSISQIARSLLGDGDRELTVFIAVGTAFTAISGLPSYALSMKIGTLSELSLLTPALLLVVGVLIAISQRVSSASSQPGPVEAGAIVGLLQGFAAIPGVSRSGITYAGLILLGYDAEEALRHSFLLSIPASLGAAALTALAGSIVLGPHLILAAAASFASGIVMMHGMIKIARRVGLAQFAVSFGILGILVALLTL